MGAARTLRLAALVDRSARASDRGAASAASRRRRAFALDVGRRGRRRSRIAGDAQVDRLVRCCSAPCASPTISISACRPVVFRRSFDGAWQTQMYELALRYERPGPIGVRVDAGQFTSPIGLSMLENRPDKNPVVSQHSTLYLPIPRYEPGTPIDDPAGGRVSARRQGDGVGREVGRARGRRRQLAGARPAVLRRQQAAAHGERRRRRRLHAVHRPALRRGGRRPATTPTRAKCATSRAAIGTRRCCRSKASGRFATRASPANFSGRGASWPPAIRRVDGGWIEFTQTLHPRVFVAARYDDQWTEWTSVPDNADRHEPYRRVETDGRVPPHAGSHPARQLHDAQGLRRRLLGRSVPGVDRLREETEVVRSIRSEI